MKLVLERPNGASRRRRVAARRRVVFSIFGCALLALATGAAIAEAFSDDSTAKLVAEAWRCEVPPELLQSTSGLPKVARRLAAGEPIKIVAIGSSSTSGVGASSPAASYPARLQAELGRLFPRSPVSVVNQGVGGQTSNQMVARFQRDVVDEKPDLVIWQTGTNSALRGGSYDEFAENLVAGIAMARKAGIDVILMGPQKAPIFDAAPGHATLVDSIGAIAAARGVPFFNRYEAMRHWLASGQMGPRTAIDADGLHMTDQSYYCVARLMARMIADLAGPQVAQRR